MYATFDGLTTIEFTSSCKYVATYLWTIKKYTTHTQKFSKIKQGQWIFVKVICIAFL